MIFIIVCISWNNLSVLDLVLFLLLVTAYVLLFVTNVWPSFLNVMNN